MFTSLPPLPPSLFRIQAAISDALTPEQRVPAVKQPKTAEVKGSWFTMAALVGVGALLVGSMAIK